MPRLRCCHTLLRCRGLVTPPRLLLPSYKVRPQPAPFLVILPLGLSRLPRLRLLILAFAVLNPRALPCNLRLYARHLQAVQLRVQALQLLPQLLQLALGLARPLAGGRGQHAQQTAQGAGTAADEHLLLLLLGQLWRKVGVHPGSSSCARGRW